MNDNKNNNGVFLLVVIVLAVVLVFFFPTLYSKVEEWSAPKVPNSGSKTDEKKEITDAVINSLHKPMMRNSIYNSNTYYSLKKFKTSDLSNSDILLNAFLDAHEGNIVNNTLKSNYIDLRINNILGKNVKYSCGSFEVPIDSSSNYKGLWVCDQGGNFVYNGSQTYVNQNDKYYNLEEFIKGEYNDSDIVLFYYVTFAKVTGDHFVIYQDAEMTKELHDGYYGTDTDLEDISSGLENKKIYKYVFKDDMCSYREYCLYSGEWVNEL